ncbi:FAD-dependent monooxygenase [Piscinibacter sp.]|uniref:FAD-dependent monooxygenase n=1 Tax=Piscinibacter sp. TaxID=1903157 RepID=UPI002CCCAB10|nr:FAD-dependent monooxygenase [Albitalea sp.]HUG23801.1 FAD-dependent monooxygenase [Albitalea sp.]
MKRYDVLVRGSGIVGHSLALALARLGLQVALQADPKRPEGHPDVRAYALNATSVSLLQSLKVWDALPAHAATPVHDMHIEGDSSGGSIDFSAWEQKVGELAWIVDAAVLERELASALRFAPHVSVVVGDVQAPLIALCEGKSSAARDALGIRFERHNYGHRAIAARLTASRDHRNIARQWFRSPDVLALLPFDTPSPQASYALVWSLPDDRARALLALDDPAFEQALMGATAGAAGELALASPRADWPLMQARASAVSGPGWVLLGDAAHVVHPLAGQGLNLGLADVVTLARVIAEREPWREPGDEKLLRRYARERLAPTWAMGQLTDGLLQLFAHPAPAVRELRNRGLTLVNHLPLVKRWLTARALDS